MISVLIPVLNEAANLPGLLEALDPIGEDAEIIVIDGGSRDDSLTIARKYGVQTLSTPAGRGLQLREGAKKAKGDIFWFLHADCQVAPGSIAAVRKALSDHPDALGGNFRLCFDGDDPFSNWLNGFYARIRKRGFYYGDSGVFVRRSVYDRIGGMRAIALMEDYDFNRKLERMGETLCIDDPPLITSSRRFLGRKKGAIIWQWVLIHLLYYSRIPSPLLARIYNSTRKP